MQTDGKGEFHNRNGLFTTDRQQIFFKKWLSLLSSLEVVPLNEVDKLELFSSKEFKKINMFSFPGCICGSIA